MSTSPLVDTIADHEQWNARERGVYMASRYAAENMIRQDRHLLQFIGYSTLAAGGATLFGYSALSRRPLLACASGLATALCGAISAANYLLLTTAMDQERQFALPFGLRLYVAGPTAVPSLNAGGYVMAYAYRPAGISLFYRNIGVWHK